MLIPNASGCSAPLTLLRIALIEATEYSLSLNWIKYCLLLLSGYTSLKSAIVTVTVDQWLSVRSVRQPAPATIVVFFVELFDGFLDAIAHIRPSLENFSLDCCAFRFDIDNYRLHF